MEIYEKKELPLGTALNIIFSNKGELISNKDTKVKFAARSINEYLTRNGSKATSELLFLLFNKFNTEKKLNKTTSHSLYHLQEKSFSFRIFKQLLIIFPLLFEESFKELFYIDQNNLKNSKKRLQTLFQFFQLLLLSEIRFFTISQKNNKNSSQNATKTTPNEPLKPLIIETQKNSKIPQKTKQIIRIIQKFINNIYNLMEENNIIDNNRKIATNFTIEAMNTILLFTYSISLFDEVKKSYLKSNLIHFYSIIIKTLQFYSNSYQYSSSSSSILLSSIFEMKSYFLLMIDVLSNHQLNNNINNNINNNNLNINNNINNLNDNNNNLNNNINNINDNLNNNLNIRNNEEEIKEILIENFHNINEEDKKIINIIIKSINEQWKEWSSLLLIDSKLLLFNIKNISIYISKLFQNYLEKIQSIYYYLFYLKKEFNNDYFLLSSLISITFLISKMKKKNFYNLINNNNNNNNNNEKDNNNEMNANLLQISVFFVCEKFI